MTTRKRRGVGSFATKHRSEAARHYERAAENFEQAKKFADAGQCSSAYESAFAAWDSVGRARGHVEGAGARLESLTGRVGNAKSAAHRALANECPCSSARGGPYR